MKRTQSVRRWFWLSSTEVATALLFVTPPPDARAQSCTNGCTNWPICLCLPTPQWASRSLRAHGAMRGTQEPDAQRSLGAVAPRTIEPHNARASAKTTDECR
jgi:hypothetical protein